MYTEYSLKKMVNLTNALDIIGDVAAIVSTEHKILFENNKCKETHGENLGRYCYNIFARQKTVCENCPAQAVFKYGEVVKEEFSSFDLNGNELYVEIVASPISNEDGEIFATLEIVRDLTARKKAEKEKENLIKELQDSLSEIKTLRGIIPICMHCKEIRDDKGAWNQLEEYITEHSDAQFSHGICDKCAKKHYPDYAK